MSWLFISTDATPKIAYFALCLAIFAFFTPGMYIVTADQHVPQDTVGLKAFLLGTMVSCISLALSIVAKFYYRNRDYTKGIKFAKSVIIVSSVILIINFSIFLLFLTK